MTLDGLKIRRVLLEICAESESKGPGFFQSSAVLREAAKRLALRDIADEQALLTAWDDLFRQGVLAWGYDLSNAGPPFLHFPDTGRRVLENLSRDPYNPDGYLAIVRPQLVAYPIALSYIEEASRTFLANCIKATAVMVGAAAEASVLATRDALVARLGVLGVSVPTKLNDWRIKTVRDAVTALLESKKGQMDNKLDERFSAFWVSISDS